ncbi:carboxymuconolactone decarboxylase family protein [Kutzneria buriramensis]|uniref:AhpD family alkylhydroperoxidase n=1 Tax=Kutzneria buriramensis TaxID=1045776 RepID=A0A3E0HDM2_9PSEU|nr:carboxymuconolactone decarboxylase family protein [Kutzneria buriramensis]REH42839.1 AhpD family alkylhydroperoxidase [Kutzneria buriramensis]
MSSPDEYVTHLPRINFAKEASASYRAMVLANKACEEGMDPILAHLIKLRASQLNGCGFCLDMHATHARELGENERRIYALPAWRELSFYTARERAALALTEEGTLLAEGGVRDETWAEAEKQFSQAELAQIIALIATINAWNRIAVISRNQPPALGGVR